MLLQSLRNFLNYIPCHNNPTDLPQDNRSSLKYDRIDSLELVGAYT